MEEQTIDRIFAGDFTDLPKVCGYSITRVKILPCMLVPVITNFCTQVKHPLVRIYTSSTFTDMTLEKNVLVTEVYPKLKEYCRERYGLEFQVSLH